MPAAVRYVARTLVREKMTTPGRRKRNGLIEPTNLGRRILMTGGPTRNAASPAATETANVATTAFTAIILE